MVPADSVGRCALGNQHNAAVAVAIAVAQDCGAPGV